MTWLRYKLFSVKGVSIIWNGFLNTLTWLGRFLSWQVGNGMNTLIGTDPLVGLDSQLFLPSDLRDYLEDYGITTLHHACNISHGSQGYWLAVDDLELGGDWKY